MLTKVYLFRNILHPTCYLAYFASVHMVTTPPTWHGYSKDKKSSVLGKYCSLCFITCSGHGGVSTDSVWCSASMRLLATTTLQSLWWTTMRSTLKMFRHGTNHGTGEKRNYTSLQIGLGTLLSFQASLICGSTFTPCIIVSIRAWSWPSVDDSFRRCCPFCTSPPNTSRVLFLTQQCFPRLTCHITLRLQEFWSKHARSLIFHMYVEPQHKFTRRW